MIEKQYIIIVSIGFVCVVILLVCVVCKFYVYIYFLYEEEFVDLKNLFKFFIDVMLLGIISGIYI